MEIEILKKHIKSINDCCDYILKASQRELSISGNMYEVNKFLANIESIKGSAAICEMSLERLEDGNQEVEE